MEGHRRKGCRTRGRYGKKRPRPKGGSGNLAISRGISRGKLTCGRIAQPVLGNRLSRKEKNIFSLTRSSPIETREHEVPIVRRGESKRPTLLASKQTPAAPKRRMWRIGRKEKNAEKGKERSRRNERKAVRKSVQMKKKLSITPENAIRGEDRPSSTNEWGKSLSISEER